jgi:aldehyde dehydrogenase
MLEQALSNFEGKSLIKGKYDNFIGGQWVAPVKGQYFDNISPVNGKRVSGGARECRGYRTRA